MQVEGSCHCGKIGYEAEIDPHEVSLCHCADCQSLTGTAFRLSLTVRREDFRLRSGAPKIYVKTAESGAPRIQAFCGDCGSPLYTAAADDPAAPLGLRVGTLRQRAELPPRRQIWHRSALPWVADLFPDLPASEGEG